LIRPLEQHLVQARARISRFVFDQRLEIIVQIFFFPQKSLLVELAVLGVGPEDDFFQKSECLFQKCIVASDEFIIDDGQTHRHHMLLAEALGLRMQRRTVKAGHFQIHFVLAWVLLAVRFKHVLH
jgi:hypothetical protein